MTWIAIFFTFRKRRYAHSWLRCTQGLGILLWCCCKTTYCTSGGLHGSTWDTPRVMYQRQCEVAEKPICIAFDVQVSTAEAVTENETVEEAEDECEESSDEEVDVDPEVSTLGQGEIGRSATFLLGARTCFGRAVRFNNRLLYWTLPVTTLASSD